jgi:hypothetical protein
VLQYPYTGTRVKVCKLKSVTKIKTVFGSFYISFTYFPKNLTKRDYAVEHILGKTALVQKGQT